MLEAAAHASLEQRFDHLYFHRGDYISEFMVASLMWSQCHGTHPVQSSAIHPQLFQAAVCIQQRSVDLRTPSCQLSSFNKVYVVCRETGSYQS